MERMGFLFFYLITTTLCFAQGSGSALKFSGGDNGTRVEINHSNAFLPNNTLSIEAWINPSAYPDDLGMIFSKHETVDTREFDMMLLPDGRIRCTIYSQQSIPYYAFSTTIVKLNTWSHIAFTYSNVSGNMRIYFNGTLDFTNHVGNVLLATTIMKPLIGAYWLYFSSRVSRSHFTGMIDEVRLWYIERSISQIREFMCRTLPEKDNKNLVAYYKLDEATGSTTADLSGKNNTGYLTHSPVWTVSGAPIGDTSVYVYSNNWANISLVIRSSPSENVGVNKISGTPEGMHFYKVNQLPNNLNDIPGLIKANKYYGIFACGNLSPSYQFFFDTDNLQINCLNDIPFFVRDNNASLQWVSLKVIINKEAPSITTPVIIGRKEFLFDSIAVEKQVLPQKAGEVTGVWVQCFNGPITLLIPVIAQAKAYEWDLPVGVSLIDGTSTTPTNTITLNIDPSFQSGYVTVRGINDCGSGEQSLPFLIQLQSTQNKPTIEYTLCNKLTSNSGSGNQWYKNGALIPTATNQTHIVTEDGIYRVAVGGNCASLSDSVIVMLPKFSKELVPNVFSPNGDQVNNTFAVQDPIKGARVRIYNRWGKQVFESNNYQNEWDGNNLPTGVYFYSIENTCFNKSIVGTVSLLR